MGGSTVVQWVKTLAEGLGGCGDVEEDWAPVLQSNCLLQEGNSPHRGLKEGDCRALKYSSFGCKRSALDARSRLREEEKVY
uniref:Uncharacterized protein n=1 Tax=Catagonus wagneri TaxID=51154 RepID=A0A8C3WJU5_9CETA